VPAAQLRGWRYADPAESTAARCKAGKSDALHIGHLPIMTAVQTGRPRRNSGFASQPEGAALAQPESPRPAFGQSTGKTATCPIRTQRAVSVIERGRIVTVLNQDKAAVLFGIGDGHPENSEPRIALTAPWSGKRWSQRLRANTASPSNSLNPRCNTPCTASTSGESAPTPAGKRRAGSS